MNLPTATSNHARRRNIALVVLGLLLLVTESGCVRRRLTVRTNPQGAQVFVDKREVGSSPASTSFVYYGTREITVIKDGYETQTIYQPFFPPWYEFPVLDFVNETLNPVELRDERVVDIEMVPMQIVPEQQLLNRADALRLGASAGQVTPLPNAQPGFVVPTTPPPPQALPGLPGQGLDTQPPVGTAPPPPSTYPPTAPLFRLPSAPGVLTPPVR